MELVNSLGPELKLKDVQLNLFLYDYGLKITNSEDYNFSMRKLKLRGTKTNS